MLPKSLEIQEILSEMATMYSHARVALRLPFSTPESMAVFPRVESTGMLTTAVRADRIRVRREYHVPKGHRVLLVVTRTGEEFPIPSLCDVPGLTVLSSVDFAHPNHRIIPRDANYPRLTASSDIVLAKAGYSTLAACVQAGVRTVYSDRLEYAEDPLLQSGMADYRNGTYLPSVQLPVTDWTALLTSLDVHRVRPRPVVNRVIAARCLAEAKPRGRRIAVIDTGTNMMMMLWAEVHDNKVHPVFTASSVTTLGKGMRNGVLRPAGIRRAKAVLRDYLSMTKDFTNDVHVFGTSCSRSASNIGELADWLRRMHGIDFEILSGEDEAFCSGLMASREFSQHPRILSFDIGGGSTEFVLSDHGTQLRRISLELGLRQLENAFGNDVERKWAYIEHTLSALEDWPVESAELIAIGGSGTNLAALKHGLTFYDPERIHRTRITREEIGQFAEFFASAGIQEIRARMPFEPERAGIIHSGVMILQAVMARFGRTEVTICERGLQFGYLYRLLDQSHTEHSI
jgi:exopolyphosphatase/guanosine-5'-triphosphate,3'-diphosphate pyrophosphatase